mmetsp:Transcript_13743/g.31845  ORF Transcript_13743/g.31845 Transcript_13743/m.31845 type:complete len:1547 (-) Transcript_13743:4516-9156(-)
MRDEVPLDLVRRLHVEVGNEALRHVAQALFGPGEEPVDCGAVDEPGELASARGELVADGREAEDQVHLVPDAVHEVLVEVVVGVDKVVTELLLGDATHVVEDGVEVVLGEQVGHLAGRQHLVNVLEEALLLHLRVGEDKAHVPTLEAGDAVHHAQVVEEVGHVVVLGDGDLEGEVARNVRRQAGQRLLAGPSHTHKHRGTAIHVDDTRDAHQVLERVLEEDELELADLVLVVVLRLVFVGLLADNVQARRHLVRLGALVDADAVRVVLRLGEEVDEVLLLLELLLRGLAAEEVADEVEDRGRVPVLVLRVGELVAEHALALVLPQVEEVDLVADHLARALEHALEGARQLAHVEHVVELGGGGQHARLHLLPQGDRGLGQAVGHLDHAVGEVVLAVAAADNRSKDVVNRREGWHGDVEHGKLPLEAVGDVVATATGVGHRREILEIHKVLPLTGLVERVDTLLRQHLAHNLVGWLILPLVDERHADVVDKHSALATSGGAEGASLALLDRAFDGALEQLGGGGVRERHGLYADLVRVQLGQVLHRSRGLSDTGGTDEEARVLVGHQVAEQELVADRVHGGDKQGGELRVAVDGVLPLHDARLPVLPVALVVEGVLVGRLAAGRGQIVADGAQEGVELLAVVELEQGADGPEQAEHEHALHALLRVGLLGLHRPLQHALEQVHGRRHLAHGHNEHLVLELLVHVGQRGLDVLLEQRLERRLLGRAPLVHPRLHRRAPGQDARGHVDDTHARHRRGRRVVEVLGLEDELHVGDHGDAVTVGEGEELVVVEHGVEVLNPDGVHGPVENNPRVLRLLLVRLAPQHGEDTVSPVVGHDVELAEHLRRGDSLGVHAGSRVLDACLGEGLGEHLDDAGLAGAGGAHDTEAVTHEVRLVELNHLVHPRHVLLQTGVGDDLLDGLLDRGEHRLLGLQPWEHVVDEREEERLVLAHQLGQVHVAQRSHQQQVLRRVEVGALGRTGRAEHRQDVAQTEVVVDLLGQLLLAKRVQHVELLRQDHVTLVADRGELHAHDNLAVGHHHGHVTEERLQVLRQLLATSVTGVAGDEDASLGVKRHNLAVGEDECRAALAHGGEDAVDLLRGHRQHLEVDAVELVEATPAAGHGQALVQLAERAEIHLVGAVEHHDELAEGATEILDGLGLASTGRAGGVATEEDSERLRKRDVASVGQRRDTQALLTTEVLVAVLEVDVGNGHNAVVEVAAPVETALLLPLEIGGVLDLVLHDSVEDIALVHLDRDQGLDVGALQRRQLLGCHHHEVRQHLRDLLVRISHDELVRLGLGQGVLGVAGPLELHAEQADLRRVLLHEVLQPDALAVHRHVAAHVLHRLLHLDHELGQVVLDVAHGIDGRGKRHGLTVGGVHVRHERLLLPVKGDRRDRVEHGLQVNLDRVRVRALGQHLQQHAVGHEVEAREQPALGLEVARQRLLAHLQLLCEMRQQRLHQIVAVTALDHVGRLKRARHDLHVVLVDALEPLGLCWQLLGNVTRGEHGFHVNPHALHNSPLLNDIGHGGELDDPTLHVLSERRAVAIGRHGAE